MAKKLLTQEDCDKFNKVLNPETNRCNKRKPVKAVKAEIAKKVQTKITKIKKILTQEDCDKINKVLNPETNRCNIKKTVKKILTEEDCFKINKILNPETNRCNKKPIVKKNNIVKLSLSRSPIKSKTPSRSPIKSKTPSRSPIKSITPMDMSESRKRKVDEFVKKRAKRIIQKLIMPFTNRVSANIDDRIKTYKLYYNYLSKHDRVQCLKITRIIKNNLLFFKLSLLKNNIQLVKRIGTESVAGEIFLSKGTNTGELFKFASKIMGVRPDNTLEIEILENLTKLVIAKKNPHFPIMYYNFICKTKQNNTVLPKPAYNKTYYINLNELANGDTKMFVHKYYDDNKKMQNAIAQIFLAIYSFNCEGYYHNDTHWGNFLFHKIKPGGYIKYNINGNELYLENIGFLWVIWDFGFATKITHNYNDNIMQLNTQDFYRIIKVAFMNKDTLGHLPDNYPIQKQTKDLAIRIFSFILDIRNSKPYVSKAYHHFFNEFMQEFQQELFINKKDLPADAVIVNKGHPYIIGK